MFNSYPLIREFSDRIPMGIAVQDDNLADINPKTGKKVTVRELVTYATDELHVTYIFWGTQEPYFTRDVLAVSRVAVDLGSGRPSSVTSRQSPGPKKNRLVPVNQWTLPVGAARRLRSSIVADPIDRNIRAPGLPRFRATRLSMA